MAQEAAVIALCPLTIYQYFSNKDEIVWAILGERDEEVAVYASTECLLGNHRVDKITAMLQYMADELAETVRPRIRFLAQFDAMYARDRPVERLLTLEAQFHDRGFQAFPSLIRQGIADGSLCPELRSQSHIARRDDGGNRGAAPPRLTGAGGSIGIRSAH